MCNKPHKHSELIKAWADGAWIEYLTDNGRWELIPEPQWYNDTQYRIKPEELKWYDNIPFRGRLCWVWDKYKNNKRIEVVYSYCTLTNCFCGSSAKFKNAVPLTAKEIAHFFI